MAGLVGRTRVRRLLALTATVLMVASLIQVPPPPASASAGDLVVDGRTLHTTTTRSAETGNNTSASSTFAGTRNGPMPRDLSNVPPGNVSTVPTRELLTAGHSTIVLAHVVPWFGDRPGADDHMDVGYRSNDLDQARRQVADMASRGIDGAVVDWYGGPGICPTRTLNNSLEDDATKYIKQAAQEHGSFKFSIMLDGNILRYCQPSNPTDYAIRELQYVFNTYVSSSAYLHDPDTGYPLIFGFDTARCFPPGSHPSVCGGDDAYRAVDWTQVRATFPQARFAEVNAGAFDAPGIDGAYSWVYARDFQDPNFWGDVDIEYFFDQANRVPSRLAIGGTYKGFDGRPTPPAWSGNKLMYQDCGQVWLNTFAKINARRPVQNPLKMLQLVTWNDYEEGTEIETGIDNCVSVQASVSGDLLSWATTGMQNTIHHFTVFISQDGENLAVLLDDIPPTQRQIDLSSFRLGAGSYAFYVKAVGQPSMLNHLSGTAAYTASGVTRPAFIEVNGQVVLAAEHADLSTRHEPHGWILDASRPGYLDSAAMLAAPRQGVKIESGYTASSPRLDYRVRFTTPGTYRVWVRGLADSSTTDSVHVGLDQAEPSSADNMSMLGTVTYGTWLWFSGRMVPGYATLSIPSAGEHVVSVWMREDGFRFDRLLLTTDTTSTPTGVGPAASSRAMPQRVGNCPIFASTATTPLSDGGCKLNLLQMTVADNVPSGWRALYWTGTATAWAESGTPLRVNEASLYRNPLDTPHLPVRQAGPGRMQATVVARCGRLQRLTFEAARNALVDIRDQTGRPGGFTIELPDQPTQVSFDVRRISSQQGASVPLLVVEDCRTWHTFVGMGTDVP